MKIWGVSSGSKGNDVQLEAIARALSEDVTFYHANLSFPWNALAPYKPAELGVAGDGRFNPPFPDMVITCGRRAVPVARYIKRQSAGQCFTVFLQNPIIHPRAFDFVWAPAHDEVDGNNVMTTILGPHELTHESLKNEASNWHDRLSSPAVTGKCVGVLIGGPNKFYDFDPSEMQKLAENLLLLAQQGHRLLISLSSRSLQDYADILKQTLAGRDYYLWHGKGDNPYKAILGLADQLIVTGDSVNMVGEACFAGVPVQVYFLRGHSRRFNRFYEQLFVQGYVKPFEGKLESWPYEPRNATPEIVAKILDAYHLHQNK
jgi:mitochondrial fission protein ELM1